MSVFAHDERVAAAAVPAALVLLCASGPGLQLWAFGGAVVVHAADTCGAPEATLFLFILYTCALCLGALHCVVLPLLQAPSSAAANVPLALCVLGLVASLVLWGLLQFRILALGFPSWYDAMERALLRILPLSAAYVHA